MDERWLEEERDAATAEEFEVDGDDSEDLTEAMKEALDAVEGHDEEQRKDESAAPVEAAAREELVEQLATLKDRHMRTLAEFDNYRKRVEREQARSRRFEGLGIISELLPILDNFGLALEAEGEVEDLKAGVELIARQFQDLLRRHGVERIRAEGEPFDPNLHDAVSREEDAGVEVPTVAEELRAGYLMGDRLVRPASVRVSVPPERRPADSEALPDPETLN